MRKPRDIDTELKALQDRAKAPQAKRIASVGRADRGDREADSLDPEVLAAFSSTASLKRSRANSEAWRIDGAAFFRRKARKSAGSAVALANQSAAIGDGPATR